MCRDSIVYDPQEVKQFLIEAKLPDPRPLIHVCDRFDFVDEMTVYLHANSMLKYIEVYVQKVSPQKTPQVVGKLLDLECAEDFIRSVQYKTVQESGGEWSRGYRSMIWCCTVQYSTIQYGRVECSTVQCSTL